MGRSGVVEKNMGSFYPSPFSGRDMGDIIEIREKQKTQKFSLWFFEKSSSSEAHFSDSQ